MRKAAKQYLLDATYMASFGFAVIGPVELCASGLEQMLKIRKQMTINAFAGIGRGYGIFREAWMLRYGVTAEDTEGRKNWHEMLASNMYFGAIYVLSQAVQGTQPREVLWNTLGGLAIGSVTARLYGWGRDRLFRACGEPPTLEIHTRQSKAAQFLALPVGKAARVATRRLTLEEAVRQEG